MICRLIRIYGNKILIIIFILFFITIIGIPILGFFQGELLGNIAFTISPSAILLDISIIITYIIRNKYLRIIRAGWIALNITVIFIIMFMADPLHPDAYRDMEIFLIYTMLMLSFPFGLITPLLIWVIGFLGTYIFGLFGGADYPASENVRFYFPAFFLWLAFFLIGYLQWFVLLPFLIRKWCHRKYHE